MEIGDKYGNLTVVDLRADDKGRVLCKCVCGKNKVAYKHNIIKGRTKSCGCIRIIHGYTNTPFYKKWENMKQRCKGNSESYRKHYKDRGIGYTKEWECFLTFKEDMFPSFQEGKVLDRINTYEGYSKDNCRWVTPSQNCMNSRRRVGYSPEYKGVCWVERRNKWKSYIQKNGKLINIGYHASEKEAARVYNKHATELFGEYACLNIIQEEL